MLNLLTQVESLARQAGELALSFQGDTSSVQYKDGFKESPVTAADLAVDAFLKQQLTALNPDYGWLSEETADDGLWRQKSHVWIVDPIDGTTGFVHFLEKGLSSIEAKNTRRQFSISIALVADDAPILGVVYTPLNGALMSAAAGVGARLNGVEITPQKQPNQLKDYTFLASTSEMRRGLLDFLVPHLPLQTTGSSAAKVAQVALGKGLVTASVKPKCWWDVAAAACICGQMDVKITDLSGQLLQFCGSLDDIDGIIAAPNVIFDDLFTLLPRHTLAGYV